MTRHIRFARDACRGGGRTRRAAIRQTRGRFSSRVGVDTRRVDSRRGGLSTTRADPTAGPLGTAGRMNHNPRPGTGNGGSEATLPAVPTFVAAGNKEFPTKAEGENARGLARDAPASFATRGAPVPARPRVEFFFSFPPRNSPKNPRGEGSGGGPPTGTARARRPTSTPSRDRHRRERACTQLRHRLAVVRRGRRVAATRVRARDSARLFVRNPSTTLKTLTPISLPTTPQARTPPRCPRRRATPPSPRRYVPVLPRPVARLPSPSPERADPRASTPPPRTKRNKNNPEPSGVVRGANLALFSRAI